MKKIFKNWTKFEIIFSLIFICVILCGYFLGAGRNLLSLIVSLLGVISVITVAKGLVIAPFISIVFNILYSILAITQKYYGEAIINFCILIPLCIAQIISWLKNRNAKNTDIVKVNKITSKEYLLLFFMGIGFTILFYFILKALNTNHLIVSTSSLMMSFIASYLSVRRSPYYAIFFMIDDIVGFTLWLLAVVTFNPTLIPSLLCPLLFLFIDLYGFIRWKKDEKNAI